jgi:hypothetical protein
MMAKYFFGPALLFLALAAYFPTTYGQKYSNEFLSIGVGAAAQGMGNAVVASVADVTAGYWNPAGLSRLSPETGLQVAAMHAEWFAGAGKFDYLGLTLPLGQDGRARRMGLSMVRFGIDNIPNTLSLYESDGTVNYDNIVAFSAADYAFLGSYSQRLNPGGSHPLHIGLNAKVVRRIIGTFADSWGFGLDAALQYEVNRWQFGMTLRDATSTFNAWRVTLSDQDKNVLLATGNELPDINSLEVTKPQLLAGAAYSYSIRQFRFLAELDIVATTDGKRNTLLSGDPVSIDPAIGLSADYRSFLFLRLGLGQLQRERDFDRSEYVTGRPSLGVGVQLQRLRLDYAFTDPGDSRNRYAHVISLMMDISPKSKKSNEGT